MFPNIGPIVVVVDVVIVIVIDLLPRSIYDFEADRKRTFGFVIDMQNRSNANDCGTTIPVGRKSLSFIV